MNPFHFLLTTLPVAALPLAAPNPPLPTTAAPPLAALTAPRLTPAPAPPRTALAAPAVAPAAAIPPPLTQPQAATWPLHPRPRVVRGFDLPAKPWLPGHRGVDLSGSPGQPVLAATSGTITYAGQLAGRGVVVISTGPHRTTYEPVVPSMTVGSAVTPRTVIGYLSAAGSHCAPETCLHWGLIQGKQYLNPLTLLPNRPVRLLPLAHSRDTQANPPPDADQPGAAPPRAALADSHPPGAEPPGNDAPGAGSPVWDTSGSGAPQPRALANASPATGERTAAAVVATTAALTLAAGLLIRRH
ncbi:peptidoglycan DD-metalloendopeptidase family protein [Kribbella sp. NPDC049174]|uniref:M23 family metallopeptidase n=1 Tax=Kribbella sp. NPDC049174 TaxID=3364112 RepID=UPI003714C024